MVFNITLVILKEEDITTTQKHKFFHMDLRVLGNSDGTA